MTNAHDNLLVCLTLSFCIDGDYWLRERCTTSDAFNLCARGVCARAEVGVKLSVLFSISAAHFSPSSHPLDRVNRNADVHAWIGGGKGVKGGGDHKSRIRYVESNAREAC